MSRRAQKLRPLSGSVACALLAAAGFLGCLADDGAEAPSRPASIGASSKSAVLPPNIVLLLADDQRFDALGAAGNSTIETPHLDRLAAEGVRFGNAFCTTSICPTSRATFLTGQYASRHGVVDFATGLTAAQFDASWIGVLRDAGYSTAFVGKWGLGGELPRGEFDLFDGFAGQGRYFRTADGATAVDGGGGPPAYVATDDGEHLTALHAASASRMIESPVLAEPFLLQLSFKAPHAQDGEAVPFQFDPRFAELYAEAAFPRAPADSDAAFEQLPAMLRSSEGRIRWRQRFASEGQRLESLRGYYRLVSGIDDALGRLREALERRGVSERTILVFSSDNGFLLGEHGLAGKWFPYEESIRIPLLIHDPRLPPGRRGALVEPMVLNVDLAPTLIELGGGEPPAGMQGRSLVPLLDSPRARDWRHDWYYEHRVAYPTIPFSEAIRTERWKLARYAAGAADGAGGAERMGEIEQLFDLVTDPHELHDLSGEAHHAERIARLRARLDELRAAAR